MENLENNDVLEVLKAIRKSSTFYVEDFLGEHAEDYQLEIMDSVMVNKVTTVRSCHGVGKSWIAARTALRFLSSFVDSIVITTAPTSRQVEQVLWRDITSVINSKKNPLGGHLVTGRLDFSPNWYAIGLSTDDPDKFQGFHPKSGYILVVVDEAAGMHEPIYEAIDAVLTSEHARLLLIGNPTTLSGTFYKSHHSDPNSHKIHISPFITPNFVNNGIRNLQDLLTINMNVVENVAPYLITPQWALDKVHKWGIDSPMFQARVLGQFPSAEENTLIPLNLLEEAATPERRKIIKKGKLHVGVDVARFGNDKTVIAPRYGNWIDKLETSSKEATTNTVGRIKRYPHALGYNIDDIGVGGGVTDQLIEDMFENVNGVNVASKPEDPQFVNLRAELYWFFAELVKKGEVALPDDPELLAELASIRYEITRQGIKIESKEEIRKRLLKSPDKADAVVLSFYSRDVVEGTYKARVGKSYDELYNGNRDF